MNAQRGVFVQSKRNRLISLYPLFALLLALFASACGVRSAPEPTLQPLPAVTATPVWVQPAAAYQPAAYQPTAYPPATAPTPEPVFYAPINFQLIRDVTLGDCNSVLQYGIPVSAGWWLSGSVSAAASCRIIVNDTFTDVMLASATYSVTVLSNYFDTRPQQNNRNRYADCNYALLGAEYYLDGVRLSGSLNRAVGCTIYQQNDLKYILTDDGTAIFFSVTR